MFFQKTKIKILIVGFIFLVGAVMTLAFLPTAAEPADELAQLNSKYGLVTVESLGQSTAPQIASLFKTDFLRADLLESNKSRQELILKLETDEPTTDLQNVLILNLQTDENIEHVAQDYQNSKVVKYAEPNFDLETELPSVLIDESRVESVTSVEPIREPIVVAVLDSGVDAKHPDLAGRVLPGWDFVNHSAETTDNDGHGTHVAGIILANSANAEILPLKISDSSAGKISELIQAIKFAADRGARVINLSLGLRQESQILQEAIDYARAKNAIIVAAAGNYRSSVEYFPAAWPEVFAVSALAKNGNKLFLSNFGQWIDFSVVAQDVSAPEPGGEYAFRTGTSQAAPVVSAKIADFLSTSNTTDFVAVDNFLLENSEPIESKYLLGRQILAVDE